MEKALKALNGPVLITGHTGFKGTWLTLLLEQIGIEVVGISLPAEEESLYQRIQRLGKIPESFTDIRNFEITQKKIKEFANEVRAPSTSVLLNTSFNVLSKPTGTPGKRTCTPVVGANIGGIGGTGLNVEVIQ